MRALRNIDRWIGVGIISVGDWALKKPHRPLLLSVVVSVFIATFVAAGLCLMEIATGRR